MLFLFWFNSGIKNSRINRLHQKKIQNSNGTKHGRCVKKSLKWTWTKNEETWKAIGKRNYYLWSILSSLCSFKNKNKSSKFPLDLFSAFFSFKESRELCTARADMCIDPVVMENIPLIPHCQETQSLCTVRWQLMEVNKTTVPVGNPVLRIRTRCKMYLPMSV